MPAPQQVRVAQHDYKRCFEFMGSRDERKSRGIHLFMAATQLPPTPLRRNNLQKLPCLRDSALRNVLIGKERAATHRTLHSRRFADFLLHRYSTPPEYCLGLGLPKQLRRYPNNALATLLQTTIRKILTFDCQLP